MDIVLGVIATLVALGCLLTLVKTDFVEARAQKKFIDKAEGVVHTRSSAKR